MTRRHEHGAAVVMALLIATLAVLLVTGLFWNQYVLARSVENRQAYVAPSAISSPNSP